MPLHAPSPHTFPDEFLKCQALKQAPTQKRSPRAPNRHGLWRYSGERVTDPRPLQLHSDQKKTLEQRAFPHPLQTRSYLRLPDPEHIWHLRGCLAFRLVPLQDEHLTCGHAQTQQKSLSEAVPRHPGTSFQPIPVTLTQVSSSPGFVVCGLWLEDW